MKKILIISLVIGGAIYGNRNKIEQFYYDWSNRKTPVPELYGTYTMVPKRANVTSGILGLQFIGSGKAIMLYDGKPLGDNGGLVRYEMDGRNLKVFHKCGVWDMKIRNENTLFHNDDGYSYEKK